jgi:hypothetical protein
MVNGLHSDLINHEHPDFALVRVVVLDPILTDMSVVVTVTNLVAPHTSLVCGQFMSLVSGVVNYVLDAATAAVA